MIRFLHPQFLYALSLVAVPVVIHLFNLRRFKKVMFTNVRFLAELKEETTRLRRLKHWLVLASRILAVVFLVLAFARPVIPVANSSVVSFNKVVSIFVDNSFSMQALSREGTLLDVAKRKAVEIAKAYPATTKFQVLTNDFDAVQQRLISKEDALVQIEQVKPSAASMTIKDIVTRQQEALGRATVTARDQYIISDFQRSLYDVSTVKSDSLYAINFVALPVQQSSNCYIDSCWLDVPAVQLNRAVTLFVKIVNNGNTDIENVPVRLLIKGTQRSVTGVALKANETAIVQLSFTVNETGWQEAEVNIPDHPITFDDRYYFSFEVKPQINILNFSADNESSSYLKALFAGDSYFNYEQMAYTQADYSKFPKADLIVLNNLPAISSGLGEELKRYLSAGGTVVVFPDSATDLNSYNAWLGSPIYAPIITGNDRVEKVDFKNPVFNDVFEREKRQDGVLDLPTVNRHFQLANAGLFLLQLGNGDAFLSYQKSDQGSIYLFAVPLKSTFTSLPRHALFVPLLYRMAMLSVNNPRFSYILGRESSVILRKVNSLNAEELHLKGYTTATDVIPYTRNVPGGIAVDAGNILREAGNFKLTMRDTLLAAVSFNYDRKESVMSFFSGDEILAQAKQSHIPGVKLMNAGLPDLSSALLTLNEGISLWKYCILAVLLFLLIEILLLRFWKAA